MYFDTVTGVYPQYKVVGYPQPWTLTIGKSVYFMCNKKLRTGKPRRVVNGNIEVVTDDEDILLSHAIDLYPDEECLIRQITMETLKL